MDFQYVAVNAQGQTISGQISAEGEREAARQLRERDLTPVEIRAGGGSQASASGRGKRATEQEKAIIIRELATLLHAGVTLAEAVESIGQSHGDGAVGRAFLDAHAKLRAGESFSQALRAGRVEWPDYLFQLVAAGEHTGKLAEALQSSATQMEYEQRVKSEMRSALLYPTILVLSGIAATLLIFIVVVPKFAGILKNSRAQVPAISVWVLKAGLFVKDNLLWVGLAVAVVAALVLRALSDREQRARLLEALARLPLLGRWLLETEIGRWSAMLATLLENRVPILRAMELAQSGVRLDAMRRKLHEVLREVRAGKKMGDALAGVQLLSVTGLNLVRVGERSGELATMLRALATLHENAGRERLKRFLILLEPAAILTIGSVIGLVMVSVMLAITSLSNIPL